MNLDEQILCIINNTIGKKDFSIVINPNQLDETFQCIGVDSIDIISIIIDIEEKFKIEIPDEFLLPSVMNTPAKMIKLINELLD
jgi:acyl carrier protein